MNFNNRISNAWHEAWLPTPLTTPGINKSNKVYKYTTTRERPKPQGRKQAHAAQRSPWLSKLGKNKTLERRERKRLGERERAEQAAEPVRSFTTTFRPFRHCHPDGSWQRVSVSSCCGGLRAESKGSSSSRGTDGSYKIQRQQRNSNESRLQHKQFATNAQTERNNVDDLSNNKQRRHHTSKSTLPQVYSKNKKKKNNNQRVSNN